MKKVHKISKMVALTLVLAIMVSFVPVTNSSVITSSASTVYLAKYINKNFRERSPREGLYLQMDYDTLSYGLRCENDQVDHLTLRIVDTTYGGIYADEIPVIADGTIETIPLSLPAGRYNFQFVDGDANILKTDGIAIVGRHDPVVQFVWPW